MRNHRDYETVRYHLVYSELVLAARQRGMVLYPDLARICGFRSEAMETTKHLGEILFIIARNEMKYERPMLSALAVRPKGVVPQSFFGHARELGLLQSNNADEEKAFWLRQKDACYRTWQQYLMDDYATPDY